MANPDDSLGTARLEAVALYTAWLGQPVKGRLSFDDFCAGHPVLRKELSDLHALAKLAQSASLHRSLQEVLGEEAEVQLTLDEAAGEDASPTLIDSTGSVSPQTVSNLQASGRYSIQSEVARGGMGIIYKVRDCELNRTLAMKVMLGAVPESSLSHRMGEGRGEISPKPDFAHGNHEPRSRRREEADPQGQVHGEGFPTSHPLLTRFLEEVQVTAQLDHPGIVAVHELGLDATGRPYFTMKLVKGRDLSKIFELARAQEEGWNLPRAVGALIKACQAVAFAHTKGVIHRDLKPANIMVGRFGEVYVMDWGLAKVIGRKDIHDLRLSPGLPTTVSEIKTPRATSGSSTTDSPLITMDGSVVGTPAYMPPEQARGQVDQVDAHSDIYSLGAILYNLLTGQAPYVEPGARISPHTILARVLDGPPKPIQTLNPSAPPELVAICEKAMAREKRDRYTSILDLAEDLQAHLDNRVVKAYRTGAVEEFKSWVSRNRALASAVGVAVLLAVAGVSVFIWQQGLAEKEMGRSLYVAHMKVASVALQEHNRGFATDLVRKYLHPADANDLRGWEWRYLWKLCQGKEQFTLPVQSSRVVALAFSPDSKKLFSGAGGVIKRWDLDPVGTNAVLIPSPSQKSFIGWSDPAFITDLAISPDGQTLIIGSLGGVIVRYGPSFASETERPLPGAKSPLALSPDGRTLLTGGTNGIIIWDTASWKPLHTLGHLEFGWRVAFSPDSSDRATVAVPILRDGHVEVILWKVDSLRADGTRAQPVSILQPGTNEFARVVPAFSKNGQILATATDRGFHLWNAKTGVRLSQSESDVPVFGMLFLSDGKTLLTRNYGQDFSVWDVSSHTNVVLVGSIPGHLNEIWSLVLAPDGRTLASGSKDGTIKLWSPDVFEERPGVKDQLHGQRIEQVVFSQDSGTIFTISSNRFFATWEASTLQRLTSYELPRDARIAVLSPQGNQLAVGLTNGAVQVWSASSQEKSPQLRHELSPAPPSISEPLFVGKRPEFPLVTWSADGQRLAAYVNNLHVWDTVTDRLVRTFPLGDKPYSIALSPNGTTLAVGLDREIELWDAATGKKLSKCVGHREYTLGLAFSPDGKTLASANIDNTAALWEVPSGKRKFPLTSHTSAVSQVAFSPDGRTLTTRAAAGIKFWNVETGRELMTIGLPPDSENWGSYFGGLRFSPDGSLLAVGIFAAKPHIQFYSAPALEVIDAEEMAKARKK